MPNYSKAVEKSVLNAFEMKSCQIINHPLISGVIKSCDNTSLVLKISQGFESALEMIRGQCEIIFDMNRSNFQIQHTALKWLKDHSLYEPLIVNQRYLLNAPKEPNLCEKYQFR